MDFFYNLSRYRIVARTRLVLSLSKNRYKKFLLNYKYAFSDKTGLEIGGPSDFFCEDIFPVYQWAKKIDGVNFSRNTLWESDISTSDYNYYPNKLGTQYILDGADLAGIPDESYDFLLSSHNLEHIANPLKALKEWMRVIKPGGFILLILPDKRFTFDRKRPYTTFEHLLADFELGTKEDDLTHLDEILALHDLKLDQGAGKDFEAFKQRGENNFQIRGMHHHVFSFGLLKQMFTHFSAQTVFTYSVPPWHTIIMAQK